jgi:hypothetical protein
MPQNTDIVLTANDWTLLTDANVSRVTFQNRGEYYILIKGTTDTTKPTNDNGAVRYNPGQGELNTLMADLFPGITAVRLWAFSPKRLEVMVSHL